MKPIPAPDVSVKRERLSAERRREQLLDVATGLVIERGFHEISIDAVAKRAGITRPVVYQHFDDLNGLLNAVIERALHRALKQVSMTELPELTESNARMRMIESVSVYLAAVRSNPDTWTLVLMPPEGAPEVLREQIAEGRQRILGQMTQAVAPILSDSADAELTASVLSAVADHYARLTITAPGDYSSDRLLAHANWFVRGFLGDIEDDDAGTRPEQSEA
jgi:AcrR family transcriptional regulator